MRTIECQSAGIIFPAFSFGVPGMIDRSNEIVPLSTDIHLVSPMLSLLVQLLDNLVILGILLS